jgi:hypothetical protein
MDFDHQFAGTDFFADLFNDDMPLGKFDNVSENSIFNEMVDAVMFQEYGQDFLPPKNDEPKNDKIEHHSHISVHKSEDEGLLFKYPIAESKTKMEKYHGPSIQEESKPISNCNEKIFKISNEGKKIGSSPENSLKGISKLQPNEDDCNNTELDNSDAAEVSKKLRQLKRPRRDVTYKTILRKCRKYYQTKFNETTGYLKQKKKEPCSFYRKCVLQFIEENFQFETHLNVSFHLGALLYPQEMVRGIESFVYPEGVKPFTPKKVVKRKIETHRLQVDKLHSILYKFTHEKLDKFILVPELAAIFLNYIQFGAGKDVEDKEFSYEFGDLTKRCNKTL